MIKKLLIGAWLALATLPALGAETNIAANNVGGAVPSHYLSTASTNATSVSTQASTVYSIAAFNTNAATAYLKFSDTASASGPTCGTTAIVATIPLVQNVPVNISLADVGWRFANGIGFCITGAIADNDSTNATTGITVNIGHYF